MLEKPPNKRIYNFRFHSVKNRLPFLFRVPECLVKGMNCLTLISLFILFYFILFSSQFFNKVTFAVKRPTLIQSYKEIDP